MGEKAITAARHGYFTQHEDAERRLDLFVMPSPAQHTNENTVSGCCFPVDLGAPRWERYSLSATIRDYSALLLSHPVVLYNWIWHCTICLCCSDVLSFSCCAATFPLDMFSSKQPNNSGVFCVVLVSHCTNTTRNRDYCQPEALYSVLHLSLCSSSAVKPRRVLLLCL